MSDLVTLVFVHSCDLGMIFGPCLGYMIQSWKLHREQNAEGFSPYVCLILLIANILRVFWWVVDNFSLVILFAAFLMIACQVAILVINL